MSKVDDGEAPGGARFEAKSLQKSVQIKYLCVSSARNAPGLCDGYAVPPFGCSIRGKMDEEIDMDTVKEGQTAIKKKERKEEERKGAGWDGPAVSQGS